MRRFWTRLAAPTALMAALVPPVVAAGAVAPAQAAPAAACPTEQYPPQDYNPQGPAIDYEIPLVAHLESGFIKADNVGPGGTLNASIGPLYGTACGLATLPSLDGTIQPQNITLFGNPSGSNPEINVSIALPGINLTPAGVYAESSGTIHATLSRTPAANGGIIATEAVTFKVTLAFTTSAGLPVPILPNLPLQCSLITGNIDTPGLGASTADIQSSQNFYNSDHSYNLFSPMLLTTGVSSGPKAGQVLQGQPVTGPPTAGMAVVVNRSEAIGEFYGDIPSANSAPPIPKWVPPQYRGCPTLPVFGSIASFLNTQFGLPYKAGVAQTTIPTTFAINLT